MAGLGNHVHITHEALVLPDGEIEGRDLLAVLLFQSFHDLPVGHVVDIHAGHKNKTGKMIFLTELPCLLRADLYAGLAVDHDDGRTGDAHRFLHLADEIKISGRIQHIDLHAIPLDGNDGRADGDLSLLLFLAEIAYGIAVRHLPHSGRNTGQICHRFRQAGLARTAVPQQDHVADLVSRVNIHVHSSV